MDAEGSGEQMRPRTRRRRPPRRSLIAAVVAAAALAAGAWYAIGPAGRGTGTPGLAAASSFTRWQGADAYTEAAAIARGAYPKGAGTAVIAATPADASAAAYLAGWAHAPVLLTSATSLPTATSAALTALRVRTVYLIGDASAVLPAVADSLGHLTVPGGSAITVERLDGATVEDAASAIAETPPATHVAMIGPDRVGLLVADTDLADQMAAADLAAGAGLPLLLTSANSLSVQVPNTVAALGLTRIVAVGSADWASQVTTSLARSGILVSSLNDLGSGTGEAALASWAVTALGYRADRIGLAPTPASPHAGSAAVYGSTGLAELAAVRHEPELPTVSGTQPGPAVLRFAATVGHAVTGGDIAGGPSVLGTSVLDQVSAAIASAPTSRTGTLTVSVADLPPRAKGAVTVAGPHGYTRILTSSTELDGLAPGRYTVTANRVTGNAEESYYPSVADGTAEVTAAYTASARVDYGTVIPATTKTLDAGAIAAVNTDAAGSGTIQVAETDGIAVGDVIAAGIGPHTPDGLLKKVTSVSVNGSTKTLGVEPATLQQAVSSGRLTALSPFTQDPAATGATAAPAAYRPASHRANDAAVPAPAQLNIPIDKTLSCGSTDLNLIGSVRAGASTAYSLSWTGGSLAMSASSTVFESADLTARATPGACSLEPTPVTAPLEGPREVFFIGDIPVVVRLELNLTIEGEVTTSTTLTASVAESYTATAGVTYIGGQTTHFGNAQPETSYKPLDPAKASGTVSMAEGPELTVQLYGQDGPVFNDDAGLELEVAPTSTPWWNLYALVYAGAEMTIPLVDKTIGDRHAFDYKFLLDHAPVPAPSSPPIASGSADASVAQADPGGNAGPVLGPDGRVWFVGSNGDQSTLVALTSAAQYYPLPATAQDGTTIAYDDELAFDDDGNAWLVATPAQGDSAGLLLRYTPATGQSKQFPLPANCAPAAPSWTGLTAATDGAVWLQCTSGGGTTALVRIAPDGRQTPATLPTGLITIGGTVAPGPGGTAWMEAGEPGSGDAGLGEFTPAGTFTYLPASDLATYSAGQPVYLAGNAVGRVVEMTSCAGMAAAATRYCFYDVAADGAVKKYATVNGISPAFGAYSSQFSLDAQGDAWIILTSATSSRQVLYEVTQSGVVSQLLLTLSGNVAPSSAFGPEFQPVRAADGTVWSIVSYEGGLIGLAGIKTR